MNDPTLNTPPVSDQLMELQRQMEEKRNQLISLHLQAQKFQEQRDEAELNYQACQRAIRQLTPFLEGASLGQSLGKEEMKHQFAVTQVVTPEKESK